MSCIWPSCPAFVVLWSCHSSFKVFSYIPLSPPILTYPSHTSHNCTSVHVHAQYYNLVITTGFSSKHKVGRVSSEPVRKKSASSAPPAKQKFPMRHKTSMPEMFPMRQQTSVPEMFPKSEQVRSIPVHMVMSALIFNCVHFYSHLFTAKCQIMVA